MFVVWMSMFFTLAVSTASAPESGFDPYTVYQGVLHQSGFDPYTVYDDNTGQAYIRNCEGAPWANHDASIHRHRLSIWGVPYSLGLGIDLGRLHVAYNDGLFSPSFANFSCVLLIDSRSTSNVCFLVRSIPNYAC